MIAMYVEHNPQARLGRVVTKIVTSIVKKSGLESFSSLWVLQKIKRIKCVLPGINAEIICFPGKCVVV